jgi:DNA polymerase III delta subunit
MLHVLTGVDEFEKQRRRRELVGGRWLRRSADDGLAAMVEVVGQADLFGEAAAVVLEDVFGLAKDEQQRLAAHLAAAVTSEQMVVVWLSDTKWPKGDLAEVLQRGRVESFEAPTSGVVVRWLIGQAEALGVKMDKTIAPQMVVQFGGNKFALMTELARLRWRQPAEVNANTLEQLWPVGGEVAVFGVVDRWAEKNTTATLEQLSRLWRQQTAPQLVLSLLERQARLLYVTKQFELSTAETGRLGIQPFMLTKLKRWAGKWSADQLRQSLLDLIELDKGAKSGGGELDFGLERWVVQSIAGYESAPSPGRTV